MSTPHRQGKQSISCKKVGGEIVCQGDLKNTEPVKLAQFGSAGLSHTSVTVSRAGTPQQTNRKGCVINADGFVFCS